MDTFPVATEPVQPTQHVDAEQVPPPANPVERDRSNFQESSPTPPPAASAPVSSDAPTPAAVEYDKGWSNPADVSMKFNRETYDFGKVRNGEEAHTLFVFQNTGKAPLEIEIISACFCMTIQYTHDLIQPGESGNIDVTFNSNDQVGSVRKDIDVIFKNTDADGYPLIKRLQVKGRVLPKG